MPYVHPPLTDEVIRDAENRLGCTLPRDFLSVLRVQNGGPIRFCIPESMGDLIAGIGSSFPSITDFDLSEDQEYVDFSLEGLMPFDGDGHWYHCMDFRENEKLPTVSYIDVECNFEYKIADSFSDFLELMELDIENERVMTNVKSIDEAQRQLTALFKIGFEPSVSNIGVPHLFSQSDDRKRQCCWLTDNKVARGYSPDDEGSFRFEGEALLFPELPPDAVIFEAPDDLLDFYREELRNAGFELVTIDEFVAL